jgi:hypothetical protein
MKYRVEGAEDEVHPLKTTAKQIRVPDEKITGKSPPKRPIMFDFKIYKSRK